MKLIAYGKTNWEKDFPSALEDQGEVKKYVSAFHSTLNPVLRELVDGDKHIMRACSLLAILPLPPGTSLRQLEIPMDLTAMRLPDWVNKIRDLATGIVMLPPTFMVTGMVIQSSVLPKLERVSGVKACRFCLHPHTVCGCGQVPSWSHTLTRQTLATVTMVLSHNTTSMSTSIACPLPGLLPQGATTGTSSCPLHPLNWGWKRRHLGDDVEEITGAGVPGCHCRLWTRALHQESRSYSKEI